MCGYDKLLISIIVPVYNIEKYIERCIKSLLNQTCQSYEIILVNDGSTDRSGLIIEKYKHFANVRVINKSNGGLSSARNAGLDAARGEYILFVDGDDYLDGNTLELLERHIDENTELILFPYVREYGDKSLITLLFKKETIIFDQIDVERNILAKLAGPDQHEKNAGPRTMDRLNTAWGKLYRKNLIGDIRFTDTKEIGPEDCWFNIQVLEKCRKAKYISDVFYHYEKGNNASLLHIYNENLKEKRWNMYKLIGTFLEEKNLSTYIPNLYRRIICEQFGLLQNVWLSKLTLNKKYRETKDILFDERYQKIFARTDLTCLEWYWKGFYFLCASRKAAMIGILFLLELFYFKVRRFVKILIRKKSE